MNRRTLLLLSYIYPPSRFFEIAGQRPYQFAKHLPQNGWRVIVVTRYWDDSSVHGEHKLPGDMPPVTEWNLASAVEAGIRDLDNSSRAVIKVPFQPRAFNGRLVLSIAGRRRIRFLFRYEN